MKKNEKLLSRAMRAWDALDAFRRERERCKRYTYGRQWDDRITVDGETITEETYIRRQGSVPLKNNMIRRLVRSVLGVWRNDFRLPEAKAHDPAEEPVALLINRLLGCNAQLNRLEELYARTMEEFLISGVAIHRKSFGPIRGSIDCRTDYVHPDNFFFVTHASDFRGWDVALAGELHEMTFGQVARSFAGSEARLKELAALFSVEPDDMTAPCRVVEVWREEECPYYTFHDRERGCVVDMPAGSGRRPPEGSGAVWSLRRVWTVSFLGPQGEVLLERLSPYRHGGHPYVVKIYPFIDGEVHSFVGDVIDQQRYTNRLITLYDWVMRASAKGVLLFPEGALPEGTDIDDIAEEWSRFNGVILFRPRAGMPLPQQVSSSAAGIGITELLNIQLKMFEDVSGVNSALQGKLESSSVSGTLYSQQTRNALTSLRDLLESFREFMLEGTVMDASNMLQFYTRNKMEAVAGPHIDDGHGNRHDVDGLPLERFRSAACDLRFS